VRGAAKALDVNHATVSRRIRQFEQELGHRLFERTASGYERTHMAEEIYSEAIHLEERLSSVSRKVAGQDKQLKGDIRITLADVLAKYLMMEDFADFAKQHSEITLEIMDSTRPFNLANREADVAFRICTTPPDYLVGRKLANLHRSCYARRESVGHFSAEDFESESWAASQHWISWSDKFRKPAGQIARDYPRFKACHKILDADLQKSACKAGMGIGVLMCFTADIDPDLVRIPPATSEHKGDLWLLYHPDLRNSAKIQTFVQFMYQRIALKRSLIEGKEPYQL